MTLKWPQVFISSSERLGCKYEPQVDMLIFMLDAMTRAKVDEVDM